MEEFVACFEETSGKDLKQFMTWYAQAGTPELVCQLKYDAKAKVAELTIDAGAAADARARPRRSRCTSRCRLGLIGGNGRDLELTLASGERLDGRPVELTKRTEKFRFRDVPSRPVPSLLRRFSAPVNLTINRPDADLQFLMANDSDLFNRWQAAQDYATRVLMQGRRRAPRAGKPPRCPRRSSRRWR